MESLIRVLVHESPDEGEYQYLDIEPEVPVLYVVKVVCNSLFDARITPPAVDLSPAGHPALGFEPQHIGRDLLTEPAYIVWPFGTWSVSYTHLRAHET